MANAPRPGAVASATIVSSAPGSMVGERLCRWGGVIAGGDGYRDFARAAVPLTIPIFDRSRAINHCCGSEAMFCTA